MIVQKFSKGCIQTREPHTKKKKLTFLKKSAWTKLSDQVQVVHKFKTRSGKMNPNYMKGNEKQKFASSAKKVQNLRKVVKKVSKDVPTNRLSHHYFVQNVILKGVMNIKKDMNSFFGHIIKHVHLWEWTYLFKKS